MIYANKGGEHVFGLLMTIIIGFLVGMIAKLVMRGKENMKFILPTLLGIAGSIIATISVRPWAGIRPLKVQPRRAVV